jgi:5'-methylthioadenosine phosphorylase
VAFIPRHGRKHELPPHRINYRANVWAMKELGVTRIFGPCAVGSLRADVEPGHFVVCDQLVDRTTGRPDTFYDGPVTTHISFADPYCPTMRDVTTAQGRALDLPVHDRGTVVVVQGPRFSTRAESAWFQGQGWEVINMTQYPEAPLARELELCYANISLVTDYDVGVGDHPPVSHEEVVRVFDENLGNLRELLFRAIPEIPADRDCPCATALQGARFEV